MIYMARPITKDELAEVFRNILGGPSQTPQAPAFGPDATQQPQTVFDQLDQSRLELIDTRAELTQTMNSVSEFLNPYVGKSDEELRQEFRRLGLVAYENLVNTDRFLAMKKLNMLKEMDSYTDEILKYNQNQSMYADQGFERKAFDVFVKTTKTTKQGTPLEQTYKYIPKSIPEAHVKFDGKLYKLVQGGTKMAMKNFRDIERIALKGGDYSDEMVAFRQIKTAIDRRDMPMHVIFKSRKI